MIEADTLELHLNGRRVGVGLIGVQAPAGNTPCGKLAIRFLETLLQGGMRLEEDTALEFDARGRRLYYGLNLSGRSVALDLAKEGFAWASLQGRESASVLAEESRARLAGLGCAPFMPRPQQAGEAASIPVKPSERSAASESPSADSPAAEAAEAPQPRLATTLPPGFSQSALATFNRPTAFVFLPDGRILVAEQSGLVKIVKNGSVLPTPFIDIGDRVNDYWDRGLLGIAADPNFATNRYVYLLYTYENNASNWNGAKTARLARYTASGDTASPSTELVLLGSTVGASCNHFASGADCIPSDSPSHTVGNLKFAADGTLFVTLGDGAHFNNVNDDALRAQNLDSLGGKVLRITTAGKGLTTNPFYNGNIDANRSKVWAYGLRNPYRFQLRPTSEAPYLGDVGWNTWEEVNVAARGVNLGWPCYEGNLVQAGYQSKAVCQSLYAQGASAVRNPLVAWNHNGASAAATGGTFYTGSAYPSQYQGAYFYGDHSQRVIRYVTVSASDTVTGGPFSFATGADGPVNIEMGPDGNLHYLAIDTGQLRVIRYTASNTPPTAAAAANPTAGLSPLSVTFSSAGSIDPDGDPLQYSWTFGDGGSSTAANPQHTYAANGTYTATLTVSDGRGGTGTANVTITVGNRPPSPTISAPLPTLRYAVGEVISYSGFATDPEDGSIPAARLSWQILIHHCPGGACHTHVLTTATGASGSFVAPDHGDDSHFELKLTATDSGGLTGTASVLVQPRTAQITLATSPSGLQLVYQGETVVAPVVRTAIVGGRRTVGAVSPQGAFVFDRWSDGGQIEHDITIASTNTTFTAFFNNVGGSGALSGSLATPAGTQSLTNAGTADWAHWGHGGGLNFNHKAGVPQQISNYTRVGTGTVLQYADNPIGFTWTGGAPTANATNTTTGIYISGQNNGFRITVPADTTSRTVTVYVGVWSAQGRMLAHLSDNSAPDYVSTSINNSAGTTLGAYTFTYQAAAPGQFLEITWTQNNATSGNVTLQAAVLPQQSATADFSVSATPASQTLTAGLGTSYTATVTAINGFAGSVNLSASGLPAGALASFNPASVTGSGSSTMAVTTATGTPSGSHTLTITGVSGALSRSATVTLVVNSAGGGGGALSGSLATPTGTQNLTNLGTADWAHWGHGGGLNFNRKAGVPQQISNYTRVGAGTVLQYADNPIGFTWTGGTPAAGATNTTAGIYISGQNNGFRITAPADTTSRTISVYVGVWTAQGRMVAHLSDNSAPDYVNTSINNGAGTTLGAYTFTYQAASPGQTLEITWTQNNASSGNVTLQAAVLQQQGAAPDFSVSATPASQTVTAGLGASYTAAVTAINGFAGSVNFSLSGLPAGASANFNPGSVTGSGSSIMAVTTATSSPAGSHTLTITGVSGALSRSATVTLVVNPAGGGGGALSGSLATPSGTQNVTNLGTADWAHWGHGGGLNFNHKAGVAQQISNYTPVGTGTVAQYANNPIGFTWTGGTPTASASNTRTGIYISGQNNGFRITVPADTTSRTITVYVGVWRAQGRMVAHLSDNSAPDYLNTSINNGSGTTLGAYTFNYQAASPGQALEITWTQNNATSGNVTLQAAALR